MLQQGLELADLPFRQLRQQLLIEPLAQHIEITGQAEAPADPGDALRVNGIRQLQGRRELLQGAAQTPKAHAHLMQCFRIPIGKHLTLQCHHTPQPFRHEGRGHRSAGTGSESDGLAVTHETVAVDTNLKPAQIAGVKRRL